MDLNVDLRDLVIEGETPCSLCNGIGLSACLECGGSGRVLSEIGRDLLVFIARWTRVDEERLIIRSYRRQGGITEKESK